MPTQPLSHTTAPTTSSLATSRSNLYAEGKVCLSLLGTWQGPGWSPDTSTLSQVSSARG
jgi:hypothetical protein